MVGWQALPMPAPFVRDLCGYRLNGNPNTSDNNDQQSKHIGRQLFQVLGVPEDQAGPFDAGAALEEKLRSHLEGLRPDLQIRRSRPVTDFEQYAHLSVFPAFRKGHSSTEQHLIGLQRIAADLAGTALETPLTHEIALLRMRLQQQDALVTDLVGQMPEEALLKVDVTVAESRGLGLPSVLVAMSCKWSLRTDRAQDCVTQGAKLVAQRRGRMPHFAVVTIEPRPAMLKILGDGSGAVDCVYHVDLPSLTDAWDQLAEKRGQPDTWSPYRTFKRLVAQGRLRDYDDLVAEVLRTRAPALQQDRTEQSASTHDQEAHE